MTAVVTLLCALGVFAVVLAALAYYVRHACDDLAVPDAHGDWPATPPDLIEKAVAEARLRDCAQSAPLEVRS
jgi:hypothetical protein